MDQSTSDSRQIVLDALEFRRPARLPVFDGFWPEFTARWRAEKGLPNGDPHRFYGIDLAVPVASEELFPTRMGAVGQDGDAVLKNDGWGRVVRTHPGTFFSEPVEQLLQDKGDLDRIEFDPPDLDLRYPSLLQAAAGHLAEGRALFVKIGGVFIRSSYFRGETQFLMDMALDEPFARAIAEKVGDHLLGIGLESLRRVPEAKRFGVWVFDDMCNLRGPMFSPQTFENVFLPVYRRLVAELKNAGARWVFLHCDGNLLPLLDHVVEAGFDGLNPVEHAAGMHVAELLPKYWGRLRFVGGVCNSHVLPGNDRRAIHRHVEEIMEAGAHGGLVIGSHSVGPDIPTEAYEFYRQVVRESWQKYG
jgi:hypothetical protein